jgi:hypothetical protein
MRVFRTRLQYRPPTNGGDPADKLATECDEVEGDIYRLVWVATPSTRRAASSFR